MDKKNLSVKKSEIPKEIIEVLQKEKSCRFKEIKDILEISGPTLSIHLKSLIENNIIQFEKKGREKHYNLSENASKIFECQSSLLSIMLGSTFDVSPSQFTFSQILRFITENIGFIFSYVLLKSMKTGKSWTESFDPMELFYQASDLLVYALFQKNVDVEELRKNISYDLGPFFTEVHKLSKKKKYGPLIDELLENLEYDNEEKFERLEGLFNYSIENYDE